MTPREFGRLLRRVNEYCQGWERDPDYAPYSAQWERAFGGDVPLLAQAMTFLGAGASRGAWAPEVEGRPPMVLKVVHGLEGIHQQRNELLCLLAAGQNPLAPRLYGWGPSMRLPCWILVERLRPVHDREWRMFTGLDWPDLERGLRAWYHFADTLRDLRRESRQLLDRGAAPDFVKNLLALTETCRLELPELVDPEHWGVGQDDEIKVADLGMVEIEAAWAQADSEAIAELKRRLMTW